MQVYMIRHGATAGNRQHRYVGLTDEHILENSREALMSRQDKSVTGKVYVSPLKRCVETANVLYPNANMVVVPEFVECNFGDFEYMNYEELNGNAWYQRFIDSGGTCGFPNGESRDEFIKRCVSGFKRICDEHGSDDIIMVVHGGTIMALLYEYAVPHREYFDWQTGNGQGYKASLNVWADGYSLTDVERIM